MSHINIRDNISGKHLIEQKFIKLIFMPDSLVPNIPFGMIQYSCNSVDKWLGQRLLCNS